MKCEFDRVIGGTKCNQEFRYNCGQYFDGKLIRIRLCAEHAKKVLQDNIENVKAAKTSALRDLLK